jgi:molecular chaperone HtpG
MIDSHFINQLEQKLENTQLKRVDAETADKIIDKDDTVASVLSENDEKGVKEVFDKAIANPAMTVSVASHSVDEMPVVITMSEFMRRMKDMAATGGGGFPMMGGMPDQYNVTINANHPITQKIIAAKTDKKKEGLAKQAYDLALLSQDMLSGASLSDFIERSVKIIAK